jgi:hypothetical protein
VLNSFVIFFLNNYWVNHPDFQLASWVSTALNILGLVLNYGFVIMLGLTIWTALGQARRDMEASCFSETAAAAELVDGATQAECDEAASGSDVLSSGTEETNSSGSPHTDQED